MKETELKKLTIIKAEGEFPPAYTYEKEVPIIENDVIVDYELEGLVIHKSAEEVYQEYSNPIPQVPQQDLQKAKLEIATLNLLTDLGVI